MFVANNWRKTGNTKINKLTNNEIMLRWDDEAPSNHIT